MYLHFLKMYLYFWLGQKGDSGWYSKEDSFLDHTTHATMTSKRAVHRQQSPSTKHKNKDTSRGKVAISKDSLVGIASAEDEMPSWFKKIAENYQLAQPTDHPGMPLRVTSKKVK